MTGTSPGEPLELTITDEDRRAEVADMAAELADRRILERALIRALRAERAKVRELEDRLEHHDREAGAPSPG